MRSLIWTWIVVVSTLLVATAPTIAEPSVATGVVVRSLDSPALSRAGVRSGDVVTGWRWPAGSVHARSGAIESVFDWYWLTREMAPRGAVRLLARRDGKAMVFDVAAGEWFGRVWPVMNEGETTLAEQASAHGDGPAAAAVWRRLAHQAEEPTLRSWALIRAGHALHDVGHARGARQSYREAAANAEPRIVLATRFVIGAISERTGDHETAARIFAEIPDLCRRAGEPSELCGASARYRRARALRRAGHIEAATHVLQRAVDVESALAPESPRLARSRRELGSLAFARGDLETAAELWRRALRTWQRYSPHGRTVPALLNDLGVVHYHLGRLDAAEEAWSRLQDLWGTRPDAPDLYVTLLLNLAAVTSERGDLERAEHHLETCLTFLRDEFPDLATEARVLENLALVARQRGEPERAVERLETSLERLDAANAPPQDYGSPRNHLVLALVDAGQLDRARREARDALAARRELAPGSFQVAESLFTLGEVAWRSGAPSDAVAYWREAKALQERHVPASTALALTHQALGRGLLALGEHAAAIDALTRAVAIQESLVPGTHDLATSYWLRAQARRPDDPADAIADFTRAEAALENQIDRLGGSVDQRAVFRAAHLDVFREHVEVLVALGRVDEAFVVLERSRARGFLDLMARREISQRAPRASVPIQLQGVATTRTMLDRGTLMLSFHVGKESVWVFALSPEDRVTVHDLALDPVALRDDVALFRDLITEVQSGTLAARGRRELRTRLGCRLYQALIGPVETRIEKAERLLILADDSLHELPWAALERGPCGSHDYLAIWKPLHFALSAGVYATLRGSSDPLTQPVRFEAFGDPWPAELPASRREVSAIAELFRRQGEEVELFLGRRATELQLRTLEPRVEDTRRIVHVATHTVVDASSPRDSAMQLAVAGPIVSTRDDGWLRAGEMLDGFRLDADLVTLSSCSSALGELRRGEGLLGLTRAIQLAGARTVVASLWDVADASTAVFMTDLYRHIASGHAVDDALQRAQIQAIERGDPPASWAAFQVFGARF
ncbi:MAG: CHAT domain-containing protein [Acidobacteriota bacterium]